MRYILLDFMPLVHKYSSVDADMSWVVNIKGTPTRLNTVITTLATKRIVTCAGYGMNNIGVCFDSRSMYRKNYFKEQCPNLNAVSKDTIDYKGGRAPLYGEQKQGTNLTALCWHEGGISCYRHDDYEADDLIYSLVCELKEQGVTEPIDIITNDRDMLPLVDEQVSVYIDSKRQFADVGCPELTGYFQVTPRTMELYCSMASAYKGFRLPYNTILLYKLLRGDTSDNVPMAVKGYGGKKFSELTEKMTADEVQFDKIFRYGVDFDEVIGPVLKHYFKAEEIARIREIYGGLCLRRLPPDDGKESAFSVMPKFIDAAKLQQSVRRLNIQLPNIFL